MGRLGQKTGAGLVPLRRRPQGHARSRGRGAHRAHRARRPASRGAAFTNEEILERTIYALVNEGARVLEEGVALRAADIDVIYLTGYGFPAFRGGPMFYADRVGLPQVYERVAAFHREHGARWAPAPLLERLAREGSTFRDCDAEPRGGRRPAPDHERRPRRRVACGRSTSPTTGATCATRRRRQRSTCESTHAARALSRSASPTGSSTGRPRRPIACSSRSVRRRRPAGCRRGAGWRTRDLRRGARARCAALAQALLDRQPVAATAPMVILSGNSIEHALLALAAMYVGVPYAPIAPAYSLQASEFGTLAPGLRPDAAGPGVRGRGRGVRARARRDALPRRRRARRVGVGAGARCPSTPFADAAGDAARAAVDARARRGGRRHDRQGPVHVGLDRPAEGRHQHAADAVLEPGDDPRRCCAFLADEPPVLCDWLPWNHTAGGNHNFGLVLYNGGTLYIDEGKPTPQHFGATLRNLREVPRRAHFTVPRTYEMLMPHLRRDAGAARDLLPRS